MRWTFVALILLVIDVVYLIDVRSRAEPGGSALFMIFVLVFALVLLSAAFFGDRLSR